MANAAVSEFVLPLPRTAAAEPASELELIARVVAGEAAAAADFLRLALPPLSRAIAKLETDAGEQHEALLHVLEKLREDGYRRLQAFTGRAQLATFLALLARELLAQRAADKLFADRNRGWARFGRIFDPDIRARIAKRFPYDAGTARREDIYQDICEKLLDDDCRRLRKYSGKGSFIGFVLEIVENLLTDIMRRDVPRQRLPAAIQRLPQLEQKIYTAIAWKGCPPDTARLAEFLRSRDGDPEVSAVAAALAHVMAAMPRKAEANKPTLVSLDDIAGAIGETLAQSDATPEEALLLAEEERSRDTIIALVRHSAAALPAEERLYLQIVFSAAETPPRREIAKILGCSVEDVDKLRQKQQRWFKMLRDAFEQHPAPASLTQSGRS
jgi:RNA polymerase primary sigma factor